MGENYTQFVQSLLVELGGRENVAKATHCATRLRFKLIEESKVNSENIKKLPGVITVFKKNGQFQVVVGTVVFKVYQELILQGGFEGAVRYPVTKSIDKRNKPEDEMPVFTYGNFETAHTNKVVYNPIRGLISELADSCDPIYAQEVLGKGAVISPLEGKVFAPFTGSVIMVYDTNHALGLKSEEGIELLIHIGIDTVELGGEHYIVHAGNGDRIKTGQLLLEFDMDTILKKGYEMEVQIIVTNTRDFKNVSRVGIGNSDVGNVLLIIN